MRTSDRTISAKWRRLDVPGEDACSVMPLEPGWRIVGQARFADDRGAADLHYEVEADSSWRTTRGSVQGRVGRSAVRVEVRRDSSGVWTVGELAAPELEGLVDLDLGFTPATNLLPLRRLALGIGESADVHSALLDESSWTFRPLTQRYERLDDEHYAYESPSGGYEGVLRVSDDGVVLDYPGLWIAE